jgi:hypothetical protein
MREHKALTKPTAITDYEKVEWKHLQIRLKVCSNALRTSAGFQDTAYELINIVTY